MGSGAGALTAAIIACDKGLDTIVLEKSLYCGGASAMSGGVVWVPNNPLMKKEGLQDSPQEAYAYLSRCVANRVPEVKLKTYLRHAPQMLAYLQQTTDVKFYNLPEYPDYYPDVPGGKAGGRSCEALPYDGLLLGDALAKLRPPHPQELVLGRLMLTAPEARRAAAADADSVIQIINHFTHYALNLKARLKGMRDTRLTLGNALMARLFNSVLDRNVPVWLNSPVTELVLRMVRCWEPSVNLMASAALSAPERVSCWQPEGLNATVPCARNTSVRQSRRSGRPRTPITPVTPSAWDRLPAACWT